jgi:hypothetical protein
VPRLSFGSVTVTTPFSDALKVVFDDFLPKRTVTVPVGLDVPAAETRTVTVECFEPDFPVMLVELVVVTFRVAEPAEADAVPPVTVAVTITPTDLPKAEAGTTKVLPVAPLLATPLTTQR